MDHIAQALGHLDAVGTTRDHLRELYEAMRLRPHKSDLGGKVAEAHQNIGYGLKAASIHAELAQAEALRLIAMGDGRQAVTL